MPRKKNDYYPDLCRFMSYTDHGNLTSYPAKTTPMFSQASLVALTPEHVVKYFNFVTYGTPTPAPNELPKHMRKYTIQYKKQSRRTCHTTANGILSPTMVIQLETSLYWP